MKTRTISFALVLFVLASCGKREQKQVSPIKVEVQNVTDDVTFYNKSYVGEVEPETSTAVSFAGSGTLQQVLARSGQHVNKGQLLAVMDSTQSKNAVMAAEAMMMQAQDAYDRMKVLHERKSISDMDWVEVQSKYTQAKSNLQVTKKMLADCSLKAPCAGIIGKKMIETGQVALPSQPICSILNINKVKVSVRIPEKEIGNLSESTPSSITVGSLGKTFQGGAIEKEIEADALSRAYVIKISVANDNHQLLPGMVCDVNLDLSASTDRKQVICVPITAVQRCASGEMFVWKATDGKAKRAIVTIGESRGNLVAITSGVAEGDHVIVKGHQKLSEGSAIIESLK